MFRKMKNYLQSMLNKEEDSLNTKENETEKTVKSALDHYDEYIEKVKNHPYDVELKHESHYTNPPAASSINERGSSSDDVKRKRIEEKLRASKQKRRDTIPSKKKKTADTSLLDDKEAIEAEVQRALEEIKQASVVLEAKKEAEEKEKNAAKNARERVKQLEISLLIKKKEKEVLESETIDTVIQRYTQHNQRFCFDTNYFFHHRPFIEAILNKTNHDIYVSTIVQQELDYNKTNENKETSSSARAGLRLLEAFQMENRLIRLDNLPRRNVRDLIGLEPRNNDDRIVAMYAMEKYQNQTPLVFCTADVGARMTARDTDLFVFDTDKYMPLWQENKRNNPVAKEKERLSTEIARLEEELVEAKNVFEREQEKKYEAIAKELAEKATTMPEPKHKYELNFGETQAYQALKRLEKDVKKMRAHNQNRR